MAPFAVSSRLMPPVDIVRSLSSLPAAPGAGRSAPRPAQAGRWTTAAMVKDCRRAGGKESRWNPVDGRANGGGRARFA